VKPKRAPEVCPVCDWEVPANAKACPNCGACHESGWNDDDDGSASEEIDYDALDLPDTAYEDPEDAKATKRRQVSKQALSPVWRIVAVVLLIALFWSVWKWLAAAG
jgi:hypothetical protein